MHRLSSLPVSPARTRALSPPTLPYPDRPWLGVAPGSTARRGRYGRRRTPLPRRHRLMAMAVAWLAGGVAAVLAARGGV